MTLEVVLATYNGEKYIYQQIESIYNQTRKVDSVRVFDDCSTDNTVEIILDFIKKHDLKETWKVEINNKNVGWRKNFFNLLRTSECDLIFLSDQDDVWEDNKTEIMESVFECNPQVGVLCSSYSPLYEAESSRTISPRIISRLGQDGTINKMTLNKQFYIVLRPGCTYAIKKDFFDSIKQAWCDSCAHDLNIWVMSILLGRLYSIDVPLIKWRKYDNSTSSPLRDTGRTGNNKLYESKIEGLKERKLFYDTINQSIIEGNLVLNIKAIKLLNDEMKRNCRLLYNFENRKLVRIITDYMKFRASYLSARTLVSDILVLLNYRHI